MENTPYTSRAEKRKARRKKAVQEMWAWVREILIALILVIIVRLFLFEIITVEGGSMLNTLHSGDRLYVSLLTPKIQGYQRGDIVICYYPGREERCVKRVIGLPGETVQIISGTVYIDGEPIQEEYLTHTASYNYPATLLDADEYFVLGDNRPISHDSHSSDVGPVTRIEGKVRFLLWPLNRFRSVD